MKFSRLSVNAELVDVRDGSVLWAEKYERPIADILSVQCDITAQISDKLRLKLTGEEKKKLGGQGTAPVRAGCMIPTVPAVAFSLPIARVRCSTPRPCPRPCFRMRKKVGHGRPPLSYTF
jgi:hypothetical protein